MALVISLFFCAWVDGLEGEAVVNDSPVDCQSRGRPSAQFARDRVPAPILFFFEKWQRRNGLSPTVLRRLASIVVSRAVFSASDTPCPARAHHEKQLSTIFPSLTFRPCQKAEVFTSAFIFSKKMAEEEWALTYGSPTARKFSYCNYYFIML